MQFTVEHLALAAQSPTDLAAWYGKVLGVPIDRQISENPPAYLLRFPNGLLLEIYAAQRALPDTRENRLAGWRHLALRVPNLELAKNALIAAGVIFTEPVKPAGGGGQVLFFSDPEGNLLHLVERPANF